MEWLQPIILLISIAGLSLEGFQLGVELGLDRLPGLRRRPALLLRFFLATFVVMPLLAVALQGVLPVRRLVWGGLLMVSVCPPSAGIGSSIRSLGGDYRMGQAWQAMSLVISIATIPATLLLFMHFLGVDLKLPVAEVAQQVLYNYFIPELAGLGAARVFRQRIEPVARVAGRWSRVLVLTIVAIAVAGTVLRAETLSVREWLFILLFSILAVAVGWLLGGSSASLRPTLAAALATRWPLPVMILARINHLLLSLLPVVVGYLIFGTALLWVVSKLVRRPGAAAVLPKAA